MKVFAVSDMHGRLEGLDPKGADLVVVAGDFGIMYGWGERDLNDQVVWANTKLREWCASYPKTQFRFVPGNHDLFAQHKELLADVRWPENAKLLIDAADEVEGLRIYGSPWVPFINGSWAFEEVWQGELAEKFAAIPEGVDLLLTHTPPTIRHEKVDVSIDRNSPHFGSVELLDALRAHRPRYALCGHIHTGDHNPIVLNHDDGSKTIVRNVSRLDEDYEVRFEPYVFEL